MREFKYKAWHKVKKKMYLVTCIEFFVPHGDIDCVYLYDSEENVDVITNPDELELVQYSSWHDCNGVAIYDGHILDFYNMDDEFLYRETYWTNIGMNPQMYQSDVGRPGMYSIVRGNVFENIELLNDTSDVK